MNPLRAKNIPLTKQSAKLADKFSDAFLGSINVEQLIVHWFSAYQDGDAVTTAEAKAWAKTHLRMDTTQLEELLRETYAIGAKMGHDLALATIGRAMRRKDATQQQINDALRINWRDWKPGNNPAQALLRPKKGLANLLARTERTARLLQDTSLSRIGVRLADALARGLTVREAAASITSVLKDSQRALVVARTEMGRALMAEQSDTYAENGVESVEWLALDPCELCAENESEGPIPVGTEFPSGDLYPPAHPNCYCDLVPVILGE